MRTREPSESASKAAPRKPQARPTQTADPGIGNLQTARQARGDQRMEVARSSLSGASEALPHFDRVQEAFGHHDLSPVRSVIGGVAQKANDRIGAEAFTSGDRVGFRQAPDEWLVAHECAHVIQQREGLSAPEGGDAWERHADRIADTVAAGGNAEPLLDAAARGVGEGPPALQLQPKLDMPAPSIGWQPDYSLVPGLSMGPYNPFPPELGDTLMDKLAEIEREFEILTELEALSFAHAVTFPPELLAANKGWTQERAETAVEVFMASAHALWSLDLPVANAMILAGKANAETGLMRNQANNPNPQQNNWFSFQPQEKPNKMVSGLKDLFGMTDADFSVEARGNGPDNPTGTKSPHFRSMREGIQAYLQIFLGVGAPGYVIPAAPFNGKILADPKLTIDRYARTDAVSGTFGGALKDPKLQAERVRILIRDMNAPKPFIYYWLTNLPPTVSPQARQWALERAMELGGK